MTVRPTFVIVGASLAGATAAESLRTEGFDGRVVLVGEEPERPYERPPLSKDYLRGDRARDKVFVHDERFYVERDIELRTATRANMLDPAARTVLLTGDGGTHRLAYDRLLLATGSSPRRLGTPGADLTGVHTLRTLADADRLGAALRGADTVAVVGAGWIGCEVAASARRLGCRVALISPNVVPLERSLGVEVGWAFRNLHADNGVDLHLGTGLEAIHGTGAVEEIELSDGTRLPADLVVGGVGATPRVELARAAGLAVDDGITVDEHLRTSDPNIFAAGDVASASHPMFGRHIRVEHWANALHQGPAAARNMLGIATPYERIPYFFSDQYDLGMEYSGHATAWNRVVFRGDPTSRAFLAFWLADGVVVAGMNANIWDVTEPIQAVIRSGLAIDPDALADPAVPLERLIPVRDPGELDLTAGRATRPA